MAKFVRPKNREQAQQLINYINSFPDRKTAAEKAGVPASTFGDWHAKAETLLYGAGEDKGTFQAPKLPESDAPIEEVIDQLCNNFTRLNAHERAKKWMPFKVKDKGPVGITWFGDPHLDDNGCNWPLLLRHVEAVRDSEGMFGVPMGDLHNNWVGRLVAKYVEQDVTKSTAYRLIQWFLMDSGIDWLFIMLGNHDVWNEGAHILKAMVNKKYMVEDWRAQFKLVFPNGVEAFVDAAHDFKGNSQFNPLHGHQKAHLWEGALADLYICGHRHHWATAKYECPYTGKVYSMVRTRGYKFHDDYAKVKQFGDQQHGASVVTIFNPYTDNPAQFVTVEEDVEEGVIKLAWLRERWKAGEWNAKL